MNFELGKIYNTIGDFQSSDFHFQQCNKEVHNELHNYLIETVNNQSTALLNEELIKKDLQKYEISIILTEIEKITRTL